MARRRGGFFDDNWPFGGFPDFDEMDRMFEDLLKDFRHGRLEPGKPLVYGFSFNVGPDGRPHFQQFGNVAVPEGKVRDERSPLVDVIEGEKEITVIAELPGVEKDKLKLTTLGHALTINVTDPDRKYYREVRLPAEVDENSAKATLKNGILEVRLAKLKPSKPHEKQIKVEASS